MFVTPPANLISQRKTKHFGVLKYQKFEIREKMKNGLFERGSFHLLREAPPMTSCPICSGRAPIGRSPSLRPIAIRERLAQQSRSHLKLRAVVRSFMLDKPTKVTSSTSQGTVPLPGVATFFKVPFFQAPPSPRSVYRVPFPKKQTSTQREAPVSKSLSQSHSTLFLLVK